MSGKRKTVIEHEQQYWHVPKFSLLSLAVFLFFSGLAWLNFGLLDWSWFDVEVARSLTFANFPMVYVFIAEYVYVALAVISFVAMLKGGYGKLKPLTEEGLVWGLIAGLIKEFE